MTFIFNSFAEFIADSEIGSADVESGKFHTNAKSAFRCE